MSLIDIPPDHPNQKCITCGGSGHTYLRCPKAPFGEIFAGAIGAPDVTGRREEVAENLRELEENQQGLHALDKAIEEEREKDSQFDDKVAYWNELYAQDLSAEEIAAKMKERFGE